jgi:hypothetical protein
MLSGRLEKALKYADKAQAQIEQIKNMDHSPFLMAVEMLFYECRIQSHLIFGNKSIAIKEVSLFISILKNNQSIRSIHYVVFILHQIQ